MNEVLLIIETILLYGMVVASFALWKRVGLFAWSVFSVIVMNIEVQMQVTAFGLDMTLGNILFATTFLVTDILSELYGKREADSCVNLGISITLVFNLLIQLWLKVVPNGFDYAYPLVVGVFKNTPRIIFASLAVYAVVQKFDVWMYHRIWAWTNNTSRFLWVRNNFSTIVSQALNAFLFTYIAFYGVMDNLFDVAVSTYIVSFVLALLDTPVIYLCRKIYFRDLEGKK